MGTLSAARIGAPQAGQRDPGRTTDSRRGTRAMTTLQKLPQTAPNSAAVAVASGDDRRAAVSSMRLDAKVREALKGKFRSGRITRLALVLIAGCHARAPETGPHRVSLAEAVKPAVMTAALRHLGGAHYHATLKMSAGTPRSGAGRGDHDHGRVAGPRRQLQGPRRQRPGRRARGRPLRARAVRCATLWKDDPTGGRRAGTDASSGTGAGRPLGRRRGRRRRGCESTMRGPSWSGAPRPRAMHWAWATRPPPPRRTFTGCGPGGPA